MFENELSNPKENKGIYYILGITAIVLVVAVLIFITINFLLNPFRSSREQVVVDLQGLAKELDVELYVKGDRSDHLVIEIRNRNDNAEKFAKEFVEKTREKLISFDFKKLTVKDPKGKSFTVAIE